MFKNYLNFSVHGNANDHGNGIAGLTEQFLSMIEQLVTSGPDVFFHNLLPGFAAMPNVHPLIVHFPIAFLSAFFFVDLLGTFFKSQRLRSSASTLLYLGVLSVICTVAAGLQAAKTIPHGELIHEIMEKHEHFGFTVASLTIILGIWRIISGETLKGMANFLHLSVAAIIFVVMTIGADLGGLMVYRYGVGIDKMNKAGVQDINANHHHDHHH